MDPTAKAAVGRVTDQLVPTELVRAVHDATARFQDVGRRLDAVRSGDVEEGHQGRVDAVAGELREAERAVEQANQAVHDHMNRPA